MSDTIFQDKMFLANMIEGDNGFIPMVTNVEDDFLKLDELDDQLPILPLRNMVLFPGVVVPVTIGRKRSLKLVKEAYKKGKYIGVITQKDVKIDDPGFEDLHPVGTVAQVIKVLEMPDGSTTAIVQGRGRFNLMELLTKEPYHIGVVELLNDDLSLEDFEESEAFLSALKDMSINVVSASANMPNDAIFAIKNIEGIPFLVNFISGNMPFKVGDKQKLLQINATKERALQLLELLAREVRLAELKNDIQNKVKVDIDQQQREYFLHQQMKTIQNELGGNPAEQAVMEMREKAATKIWGKKVNEIFEQELAKLERMNPAAADYSVQVNYLHTLLDLPWDFTTTDNFDLKNAKTQLDKFHFGLENVKERILEYLAVLKLKGDMKSPIICLAGPPGVGKTSLGQAIATALGRKYVRVSLGGLHDESEIRGHRKTYIGAMPGRIIQGLKKAGTANPVFVLDEIDKVSSDFRGDPASALLEVLDPEQNTAFHDNFIDIDIDFSKVMFIATANNLSTISQPLRDRMEIIDVSGYILDEKVEIAKRHLIPNQLINHGLKTSQVSFQKKALEKIIESYTRESGVRELDKKIAAIMRKAAAKIAVNPQETIKVLPANLKEFLGVPRFLKDEYQGNEFAGVVTGLAWTAFGGEILYVESSLSRGKGGKISLTGNLGDVMKESAVIALEYIKAHSEDFNVDYRIFDAYNLHVHVPEGAIPKDGPSAGITMVTSLLSALTQRKVRKGIAMTGEITLRGKVLPVGGIKEKILAAKRAGINTIVLCESNRKDVEDINEIYLKGLEFHYVKNVIDVVDFALLNEKVKNSVSFKFEENE